MKMEMWKWCTLILTLSREKRWIILMPNFKQQPCLCICPKNKDTKEEGWGTMCLPCVNEKFIKLLYKTKQNQKKKKNMPLWTTCWLNSILGTYATWYHLLSSITSSKKKKKNPFWKPLLNYVITCSLFGYVGSLVSFIKFSHILKNYHPLLNYMLT